MSIAVCRHGNKIDVEFVSATIGNAYYRQTAKVPVCRQCVLDATMEAMERMCESDIEEDRK